MATKLSDVIQYMYDTHSIVMYVGYNSKDEGNYINKYNGRRTDSEGYSLDVQLSIKRYDTNITLAYEKAETDARDILNKIRERYQVTNVNEIPLGRENNSYIFNINFTMYERL